MANEVTVPVLPCRSIDEIAEFYTMLGFATTYRQQRPNPYVSLQREDLHLHFFGMQEFRPEDSYGTCLVLVADTGALFDAFAAGMRATHGKLLVAGIPRMTRPRKRKNAEGRSGFTVIDPGGNWIRVMAATHRPEPTLSSSDTGATTSRLAATLRSAVVMGDSHGKHVRAAEILDAGLDRHRGTATTAELAEALAYRAELALRAEDRSTADEAVARLRALPLSDVERDECGPALAALEENLAGRED